MARGSRSFPVGALPEASSEELAGESSNEQRGFAGFGDSGAAREYVVVLLLDGAENIQAAPGEEVAVDGKFAVDHADERQACLEHVACVVDFVTHEVAEGGSKSSGCNGGFIDAEV